MQLQHIYDKLKDEKEIAIIKKYGYNVKCYTAALTGKIRIFHTIAFFLINIYIIKI